MTKFELEQVDVTGDGRVVLYKRPNLKQPKWQARIRVTGATGYKRFSTQETNLAKAQQIALNRYEELYFKVKQGGSLNDKTVQKVYEEWIKSIELDNRNQDIVYARQVELRLLPLLGGIGITDVSAGDLSDIIKSISNLASSTRRSYRTAFNRFFAYAYSKKYVTAKPAIEAPALKRNPRPDISNDEWRKLYTFMRTWVTQTTKGHRGKNGLDHKRHRERFYLQHYVLTLANTGIRVGEARNLRWVDLDKVEIAEADQRLVMSVDGKTGKRDVIANPGVETYLKRLWEFRSKELKREPEMGEPIFCHPDGRALRSYKKGYESLLRQCGLREDADGNNRTLYSLRHTYATMRINEVPVYQLAVNMGTSVEMIENYYSHARSKDALFASVMTKGNQTAPSKALPWD